MKYEKKKLSKQKNKTKKEHRSERKERKKKTSLEGQTKFHSHLKAFYSFPLNLSHSLSLSLCLSCLESLSSSIQPCSATKQWMHVSHATPPRHRWTRHSQRHLALSKPPPLHSSHGTWACQARREKGITPLVSIWLRFPIVPQKGQQKWAYSLSPPGPFSRVRNCLLGRVKTHAHIQSSKQPFPLVRCYLLENNNASRGLSFKEGSQPLEGQSDQIDLWLR